MTFNQNADQERTKTISSDYTTSGETTILINETYDLSIDGFEDGDYTNNPAWTESVTAGGTFQIQSNTVKNGSNALEIISDGQDDANGAELSRNVSEGNEVLNGVTWTFWIRFGSLNNQARVGFTDGNEFGKIVEAAFFSDGSIILKTDTGDKGTGTFSANEWYKISITPDTVADTVDMKVEDETGTVMASTTDATATLSNIAKVRMYYRDLEPSSYSVFFDDITYQSSSNKVTLSSSDASSGKIVRVVDTTGSASSNSVTIDTESSELINGETSATLNSDYEGLTLQSDGSDWFIISRMSGGTT